MGRINSKQMGLLCHLRKFQDPIQFASFSIYSSNKSESIFLPVVTRKNKNGTSPVTGSGKGNRSGNSWYLLPAISFTQRENGKLCPVIDLAILMYVRKQPFKMETTKSVRKLILIKDWAVSIYQTNAYYTPPHNSGGVLWFHIGCP